MQQLVNLTQQTKNLLYQIKALAYTIKTLKYQVNNNRGRGERGANKGDKSGGEKDRRQRNSGKYCWSNVNGGHKGATCRKKSDVHKDEATFQEKIVGSTKGCYQAT